MDKLPYREFLAFTAMTSGAQTERYLGGDMSLLPSYEEQRTVYKDYDGKRVDLLPFLRQQGWNMVRVRLMIVETAAYYSHENDPWATADKYSEFYPISTEGQAQFTRELVTELKRHQNVIGLFWWFPEENAAGNNVTKGWVNRGLFDNHTGRALPALKEFNKYS